ncbi:sulfatase [Armatimonas sp.]|uniref:sulfatase n=1 Tax=Armatimonas sp. TaxID=1872638 RepID=UPI0037535975
MKLALVALTLLLVPPSLAGGGREQSSGGRFNVLFIAVDDLRPELGCYGVKEAQSPNIDRLAKSGMLFTRHYAAVATCGASRYALLTGRSPARSGVTASNEAFYQGKTALDPTLLSGAQTLPELFRRSGYQTVNIGKISHTADGRVYAYNGTGDGRPELPHAWDALPTPFGGWKRGWGIFFAYENGKHREDGQGNNALMEFTAKNDDDLPDGQMAQEAISQLKGFKNSGKPFFLGLGFFKPHLPFVTPKQDWDAFEGKAISLPKSPMKPDAPYWHASSEFYKYSLPFAKAQPLDDEAKRTARRAYLACVRYTDRQVGKVLDALKAEGLDKNTIVVVWGDHGWHLGEQQIWGKHSPFERAVRSTLIVRAPGVGKPGEISDALIESGDLYPTLTQLCQPSFTQTRYPLDGKSFAAVLAGKQSTVRDSAISYWQDTVTVRTATHRLIARRTKDGTGFTDIALYDLSKDLDNTVNLASREPDFVAALLPKIPQRL